MLLATANTDATSTAVCIFNTETKSARCLKSDVDQKVKKRMHQTEIAPTNPSTNSIFNAGPKATPLESTMLRSPLAYQFTAESPLQTNSGKARKRMHQISPAISLLNLNCSSTTTNKI